MTDIEMLWFLLEAADRHGHGEHFKELLDEIADAERAGAGHDD